MSILVIDIGSSSVRAMLFDEFAQPIPQAEIKQSYSFFYGQDGEVTIDPLELQNRVETCVSQLLQNPQASSIEALGISTFVGNVMGIDASGNPITPVFTYADTRSSQCVDELQDKIDLADMLQRTGCRLHSAYNTVKLYWYQQTYPEIFASIARWMDFTSYLYLQWFGETRTSYSVASWSGLLNRQTLTWDEAWLDRLGIEESNLTTLADVNQTLSGLTSRYAEKWASLAQTPFYLPIGDGASANLGSGAINRNYAALSVGSTSALRYVTDQAMPMIPEGLWGYRVTVNQHLIGGATTEGGTIFAWAKDVLTLSDNDVKALDSRLPDQHGLTILPLFAGERSPGWRGQATATIHGLQLSTSATDIMQALLESVAFRLTNIADMLLPSQVQIMASGGALISSKIWAQMIANSLNRQLNIISGETSARGIAVLILSDLHHADWSIYKPEIASIIEPQANSVAIYQQSRERQKHLYQRLYDKTE